MSDPGIDRHYHQIRKELVAYARSLGMKDPEAEDTVHATLLKAWERKGILQVLEMDLPYLKVMVKNLWVDGKRANRTDTWPDDEFVRINIECDEKGHPLLDRLEFALEKHRYGYIVLEMEKRGLRSIKELAPYVNQKKDKLYKRYQKLIKELQEDLLGRKGL